MSKMLSIKELRQHRVTEIEGWTIHVENHVLHNDNGPALFTDNHKEYYINGELHNENGPARIFKIAPSGKERVCEWWFNGKFISSGQINEETFNQHWDKK